MACRNMWQIVQSANLCALDSRKMQEWADLAHFLLIWQHNLRSAA